MSHSLVQQETIGSPCKQTYATTQLAFYTGHQSCHRLKMETVFLPNGMSTLYSLVSCRHHDYAGGASVLDMSGWNEFVINIQHGLVDLPYSSMGYFIYRVNLQCIQTYFSTYFPLGLQTLYMRIRDADIKACRQGIECDYVKPANTVAISNNPDNFYSKWQMPIQ